jgi:hypothetical protein
VGETKTDSLVCAKRLRVVLQLSVDGFLTYAPILTRITKSPVEVACDVSSNPLMGVMEVHADPFHQCYLSSALI